MLVSTVNHTKATTLPRTTSRWCTPLPFFNNRVSLVTAAATALGVLDVGRGIIYQEENSFSFWNHILRPASWLSTILLSDYFTRPPKDSFETDLLNNSIKDVADNMIGKMGDKNSFVQILNSESVENLTSAIDGLLDKAFKTIYADFTNENPEQNINLMDILNDGRESFEEEQVKRQRELIKRKGVDFLHRLSKQDRNFEKKIMSEVFACEKDGSESKQIALIRKKINEALEPCGLSLGSIHYDRSENGVRLSFFSIRTYPGKKNNSNDEHSVVHILTFNPEDFLDFAIEMADNISYLRRNENIEKVLTSDAPNKETLERLNRELFTQIILRIFKPEYHVHIKTLNFVYDPETKEYPSSKNLALILNSTGINSLNKLMEIMGQGFNVNNAFGSAAGLGAAAGAASRRDSGDDGDYRDYREPEPANIKTDTSGKRNITGTAAEYGKAEEELKDPIPNVQYFEDAIKELGIRFNRSEDTKLTRLKIALLNLYLKSVSDKKKIEDFTRYKSDIFYVLSERLRKNNNPSIVSTDLASMLENLPIKDEAPFQIQDRFLDIKYFISIALEGAGQYDALTEDDLHRQDARALFKRLTEVNGGNDDVKRLRLLKEYIKLEDWEKLGSQAKVNCQQQIIKLANHNSGGEKGARIRLERLFSVLTKHQADMLRKQLDDLLGPDHGGSKEEPPSPPEESVGIIVEDKITVKK